MRNKRKPKGRPVDGILVLNKPGGITSNAALQAVKAIYFAAKAGHTGSLDPLATGVLPICLGEATKFSQYLLDADKAYRSTFVLGEVRTTGDAEGDVVETCDAAAVSQQQVLEALEAFRGEIEQVPSMFSAIKVQGQPLYKLAREGIEVEREARKVTIFSLELEGFRPGERAEVDVFIHCSKGTYVRSIAEDLGRALGVGAYVSRLHRVKAGPFTEEMSHSLDEIEELRKNREFARLDEFLLPPGAALEALPDIRVTEDSGYYLRQGQPVLVPRLPTEGVVRIHTESGEFIGVGEVLEDGRLAPRRLVVTAAVT